MKLIGSYTLPNILLIIVVLSLFSLECTCYEDKFCHGCKDDTTSNVTEGNNNWKIGSKLNLVRRPKIGVPASTLSRFSTPRQISQNSLARSVPSQFKAIVPPTTPSQAQSAGIFQDGNDFSYFAEVFLGSQKSKMYMLLDTGASMSWVMGEECKDPICLSRNRFGSQNSSTYEASDTKFSVSYGTGACSGTLAHDTVSFAGLSFRMPFGVANTVSQDFGHFEIYGILGLSIAKSKTSSFIGSLIESKSLKRNMFGMSLSRTQDGINTGEINFGAPDTSRFTGDLKYYPLAGNGNEWVIELVSAGFGETQIPLVQNALLDTGTSYIFAPIEVAKKIYELIPGATTDDSGLTWQVPCDTKADLVFKIGSDTYSIPSTSWVGKSAAGDKCHSHLGGTNLNNNDWVIGDFFLKNYYVVFDIDKRVIGLAISKNPSPTLISHPPHSLPTPCNSDCPASEPGTSTTATTAETNTNTNTDQKSDSSRIDVRSSFALLMIGSILYM